MNTLLVILILVALFLPVVLAQLKKAKRKHRPGTYRRRRLMTDNEHEFFGRLVAALPDYDVFAQVAMSALLEASSRNRQQAYSDFLRIAQQRVDYVVCSRSGDVIAVVELDDSTHSAASDRQRDARFEQAGIRTVRFQARRKPGPAEIRVSVLGATPVPAAAPAAAPAPASASAASAEPASPSAPAPEALAE